MYSYSRYFDTKYGQTIYIDKMDSLKSAVKTFISPELPDFRAVL